MERALEVLFRRGVIPFCCGGASICFGLYSFKVSRASAQWAALDDNDNNNNNEQLFSILNNDADGKKFLRHSKRLDRHAATCAAMSLVSAASAYEAIKDWKGYRNLGSSIDHVEDFLMKRRVFVLRVPVLATMTASWIALEAVYGGIQILPPTAPQIIIGSRNDNRMQP